MIDAGRVHQKHGNPRIDTPPAQTAAMGKGRPLGFLLSALATWPQIAGSQGMPATVLSIGDGDTIRVRQATRAITVRLACIDAPETAQNPYGQQARKSVQQRLPIGRQVTLAVKTTDRYGRTVAEVISDININLALQQLFQLLLQVDGGIGREGVEFNLT